MSFNEIALDQGLEIAKVLSRKKTLQLLDLNGNKFGEEGKLDLIKLLEPIQSALCTMRFISTTKKIDLNSNCIVY